MAEIRKGREEQWMTKFSDRYSLKGLKEYSVAAYCESGAGRQKYAFVVDKAIVVAY